MGELTTASIFACVMVHDTVKMTARLQYFHISRVMVHDMVKFPA